MLMCAQESGTHMVTSEVTSILLALQLGVMGSIAHQVRWILAVFMALSDTLVAPSRHYAPQPVLRLDA